MNALGKSSISRIYEDWSHLDHQPFRALVYLALRSLDEEAPPVYYAGWEALAAATGIPWDPQEPFLDHLDPAERKAARTTRSKARRAAINRVGRILRTLEEAGAILRAGEAQQGSRQVIGLTLEPRITYTARAWTSRPRFKTNSRNEKELIYEVRVPDWQPVEREDPRPPTARPVSPDVVPGDAPDVVPGDAPQAVPQALHEVRERYPPTRYPKRTNDPQQDPPDETAGGLPQSPPSATPVRARELTPGIDDESHDLEAQRNRQTAALAAWTAGWSPTADDQTEDR